MEKNEEQKSNFEENVDEIVPETPIHQVIKPIQGHALPEKKNPAYLKSKRLEESNRLNKRRAKNRAAKMSRKKNRRKK